MGAKEFGRYVDQVRRAKGWSQGKLGLRIGELPDSGRFFDATGIRRILEGGSVRLDRELVDRLVQILDLDEFTAYELADLRPRGFTAADHRDFLAVGGTTRSRVPATTTASRAGSNPKWQPWTRRTHVRVRHLPVPRTADHAPLAT